MKKGISPLIASVLLIAFTLAVAVIITTWITGFTTQQTGAVSTSGEEQMRCSYSVLSVDKDEYRLNSVGDLDIAVSYDAGTKTLNITSFVVRTNTGTYTGTNTTGAITPGQVVRYGVDTNVPTADLALKEVRVNALCANQFAVSGSRANESV